MPPSFTGLAWKIYICAYKIRVFMWFRTITLLIINQFNFPPRVCFNFMIIITISIYIVRSNFVKHDTVETCKN